MTFALHPVSRPRPVPRAAPTPLRIGVLTPHNPHDRRAFSGTVFNAVRALAARDDLALSVLGPHRKAGYLDRLLRRDARRFDPPGLISSPGLFDGLDLVLGIVATPLLDAAAAVTDLPFIHVTDATPGFLREVYGRAVPQTADAREARVLGRAVPVYSSRFMAKRAGAEFGPVAAHAQALPFGVNFDTLPDPLPEKPPLYRLELLFVGTDWTRKGGALALDAFDRLRAGGRDAHLTLVGHMPEAVKTAVSGRRDVTVAGFLDKNRPRDAARLSSLFGRAHLLVLPTRADCTPMVVAEALAHGTPVLATDIGGIGEMLGQGAGRVLPPEAAADDWAGALGEMGRDSVAYAFRSDAATERVATRLSWASWAEGIATIAVEAVVPGLSRAA